MCYYTLDGSPPAGALGVASNGSALPFHRVGVAWDTFIWGYRTCWEAELPAQPEGTVVRYRIGAWGQAGEEIFCDWPDVKATQEEAARAFFHQEAGPTLLQGDPATGMTFNYHVDRLETPQWAREAVIYQIFVDRFSPGRGKPWKQTGDLKGFFGGTLWGIVEQVDYIADLGATCIWLSPVFPSPTSHGYDATDYEHVETRLGGDASLRELVSAAHRRGLRVLLDLVCNHISDKHPFFIDALRNPESPYREWFFFDDPSFGYRTYFGVPSMPQLNLASPSARDWMFAVARYWLREFDVDGYRLDHADGPGPSFWSDFWAACRQEKPDAFCFGEIVGPPADIRKYSGRMDGALDFILADALRKTFAYRSWDEEKLFRFIGQHLAYFPPEFLMLTFLDNHDMDRFLFIAADEKNVLRKAAALQMRLPGPPVIYYGTEVGLSQTVSKASEVGLEASRMAMFWGEAQDHDLLAHYQFLIRERFASRPWIRGEA
jgi:glycosidase